jgi:membrane associated rhomboid family serine protease
MGIYDRDYYRREGPSFLGSFTDRGKVCKWLVLINVLVFIAQILTAESGRGGFAESTSAVTQALELDGAAVLRGEVWRLLTYAFLHSLQNPWHILINMLLLWWLGSAVEDLYGRKEFLAVYLTGALFGGLAFFVTKPGGICVGASGAVSAVAVIFACHYPFRTVLLFFVIPMPMWLLVTLFVAQDLIVLLLRVDTQVAVAGHLGGAAFGFLYYKSEIRLTNLWPSFKGWRRRRSRPPLRVYRGEEEPPAPVGVAAPKPRPEAEVDEHLEAKLDAVLEKMSLVGQENLTDSEREILLRASEIYRKRRS